MYQLIIVEDDEITRNALCEYISEYCTQFQICGTFHNGQKALEYLLSHQVHVILTDIKMPKMDGLTLCAEIRKTNPFCHIVIISGYGTFEYARQAIQYGVKDYLLKPINFREFRIFMNNLADSLDTFSVTFNTTEEDIALLFTDIIYGRYKSAAQIQKDLSAFQLPLDPLKHSGHILRLSLPKDDTMVCWQYEKARLPYAFTNILRMKLADTYVCNFLSTGPYYFFIALFLGETQAISESELTSAIFELLCIKCTLTDIYQFNNLHDLSTRNVLADFSVHNRNTTQNEDAVIRKVIEYINTNYDKDISRQEISDMVYFSSAYFSRFFKEKTGVCFIDYLTKIRMEKAIELLLHTNLTIDEITNKVGYKSRNQFILNFRQYTSLTPSEYRKRFFK